MLTTGCRVSGDRQDGLAFGFLERESEEERQIRRDRLRLERGVPLKYHKDKQDLREHELRQRMRASREGEVGC